MVNVKCVGKPLNIIYVCLRLYVSPKDIVAKDPISAPDHSTGKVVFVQREMCCVFAYYIIY